MLDAEAEQEQCPENMAGALANQVTCCDPCEDPVSVAVPGPAGEDGTDGVIGTNGVNAFTTFAAAFTMPAADGASSAVATVGSTAWMSVGEILYAAKMDGSVIGYFQVTAIGGATSVTLLNLENTATGVYASNSAPASVFDIGSKLQPGGAQGPAGLAASTTIAGQVTGTLAASELTVAASIGALPVGNGSEAQSLAKGTEGHALVVDTAGFPLDIGYKQITPITDAANFNIIDNRLGRLDGTTGLPIPIQGSMMGLTDTGALQSHFRIGAADANAKGADAVDLQSSHNAITQVAGGQESVIAGGKENTASGVQSVVSGGESNTASGQESVVSGGGDNVASGVQAVVGGGDTNTATGEESTVSGGGGNDATADQATIGGGRNNDASGNDTTVAGGRSNVASAVYAAVGGGNTNVASGSHAAVSGGALNVASGIYAAVGGGIENVASALGSCVPGGIQASASQYGQIANSAGFFVAAGDAQASDFQWRAQTDNANPRELYLNGSTTQAVVPASKSWMFQLQLVARKSDGLTSIYKAEGLITRVGATTSMPAAATVTEIYDGIGLPATPVVVTADDPNDALIITVTGIAATSIRWVATARIVEVAY